MPTHIFNVFTCNTRWPFNLRTGTLCILHETDQGLVLVDTGPGRKDYIEPHGMLNLFRVLFSVPLNPREAVFNQIKGLGYNPEDVRHIVLTHMHFDHCGGLPDFPWAKVHLHRREYEAFTGRITRWTDLAYIKRHIAHKPDFVLYEDPHHKWFEFNAIQLPFKPEMYLVPLFGHSWGHCGVAVKIKNGWFFNAADAGAVNNNKTPAWLIRLVLGPHDGRLREFMQRYPEVHLVNSHMWTDWFFDHREII